MANFQDDLLSNYANNINIDKNCGERDLRRGTTHQKDRLYVEHVQMAVSH